MRDLTSDELKKVSTKITKYISQDSYDLLFPKITLKLHNQKVFQVSELLMKHSSTISRKELLSLGSYIGKFTKTDQFRITIPSINILAQHGVNKIWVKNSAEMNFLYGNDIMKSHVLKTSENIALNAHAFVFNQNDQPIGFGVTSKSSTQYKLCEGKAIVLIHQADVGEYLREQDTMF